MMLYVQSYAYLLLCPSRGVEYCNPVCLYVCVCICSSASISLELLDQNLHEIFCADLLWPWLGPPLAALRYVMNFRFYG